MKTYWVSFKIVGTGFASIDAETREDAEKKLADREFSTDPKIDDWDINSDTSRGGYLELNE